MINAIRVRYEFSGSSYVIGECSRGIVQAQIGPYNRFHIRRTGLSEDPR